MGEGGQFIEVVLHMHNLPEPEQRMFNIPFPMLSQQTRAKDKVRYRIADKE